MSPLDRGGLIQTKLFYSQPVLLATVRIKSFVQFVPNMSPRHPRTLRIKFSLYPGYTYHNGKPGGRDYVKKKKKKKKKRKRGTRMSAYKNSLVQNAKS